MEDQISRTIENSWSKNLAEIRSMLQELVGNLTISKPNPMEFQRFCENHNLYLSSSYLDGAALTWYLWLFQNKQLEDWEHFTAKVLICFYKRHLKSPEDLLANL
ncbi:hypothetical protein KY290_000709 [Solanum tuberosum]|uniref:Retrotransposon gag domain-containing protein n=1 Tax=Solanum tuberosum TaxID=4113 RepID=A0ABQ7WLH9_SOLTU|nr:hypothetical protein KY290_000709 [Solanum tuberosum]